MRVQVGTYWYTVRVSHRVPEGKAGYTLWAGKEILISPQVAPEDRLEVLGHEYYEAYLNHYPAPSEKESSCDLFASLFKQLMESLGQTGGLTALLRLMPERGSVEVRSEEPPTQRERELVYVADDSQQVAGEENWITRPSIAPTKVDLKTWEEEPGKLAPGRMFDTRYCPGCQRPVSGPQVVDVRQEDPHFGPVLFRTIHCTCLPGLWHWFEPAGAKWKPALETGSLEARPRKTTDPKLVKQWMKIYPHAVQATE